MATIKSSESIPENVTAPQTSIITNLRIQKVSNLFHNISQSFSLIYHLQEKRLPTY
ncbi:unnamed protein product [Brugia timori]|uniref:Uncharacterized protein n=1 Tax=Brugia timori TaxID=42155 RepID=A0A0R3QHG6_9BILA|nr:unnamed protein product [Brugia timori]